MPADTEFDNFSCLHFCVHTADRKSNRFTVVPVATDGVIVVYDTPEFSGKQIWQPCFQLFYYFIIYFVPVTSFAMACINTSFLF